nr:MAG TPA: hypothetical protein [Caudoviricetes sp.]
MVLLHLYYLIFYFLSILLFTFYTLIYIPIPLIPSFTYSSHPLSHHPDF